MRTCNVVADETDCEEMTIDSGLSRQLADEPSA
jgi:hypothetical protein